MCGFDKRARGGYPLYWHGIFMEILCRDGQVGGCHGGGFFVFSVGYETTIGGMQGMRIT